MKRKLLTVLILIGMFLVGALINTHVVQASRTSRQADTILLESSSDSDDFAPLLAIPFLASLTLAPLCLFVPFIILALCIKLFSLVLSVSMIIDCLNRDFENQTLWVIILFLGIIFNFSLVSAGLYYFMVKRNDV